MEKYKKISKKFFEIISDYNKNYLSIGIDECCIEITDPKILSFNNESKEKFL